ncbi:MAG: hypothetical protein NC090_05285 [Anaeroplasma bactoclasticum]|nr:hypothetical protein [Anaeroplasma bactoclasticum]
MNIYEDYEKYIGECDELLDMLKTHGANVYYAIADVLKVTEYIYHQYETGTKVNEDLEEIFDIGYGFLSNVLADMKTYYEDCFDKNKETFEHYSELLLYSICIEDYKSFLSSEELLTAETEKELNRLLEQLDGIFTHQKEVASEYTLSLDAALEDLGMHQHEYQPAYAVFQLIAEELELV